MPQDNSKWSHNLIYSNNNNLFNDERDAYCRDTPWEQRDPQKVCPTFQVPVGTGHLIAGGNANIVEENYIFDNWRRGTMLHWVPAALRGEEDAGQDLRHVGEQPLPAQLHGHAAGGPRQRRLLGLRGHAGPERRRLLVGRGGGPGLRRGAARLRRHRHRSSATAGRATSGSGGQRPSSDPPALLLPACPGLDVFRPGNSAKQATLVPCATWHPIDNPDPPGCDWFTHAAGAPVGRALAS